MKFSVKDLTYIALGTVLITVCSWISIPTAVPFTMQTFAVFFILSFLGGKRGLMSIIVYILLGLVGVPVFSGMVGGLGKLIGPTGGYIIGFILMAIIYWMSEKLIKQKMWVRIITLCLGLLICYAFGTAWFMVVYAKQSGAVGLAAALGWCVIPFIIPDLVKLALAVFVAAKVKRFI